jgi:UDP-N-acetylmuramate--alanine ligase
VTFERGTRVHVVGVGGAGMSALAALLQGAGCRVSGCDVANVAVLEELRERGVEVSFHHGVEHVADVDVVLWSPAVAEDHPELRAARDASRVMVARPDVLAKLASDTRLVGITGTHGKTTATSMLVCIMAAAGRDDSRLLGAPVRGVGASGYHGTGDLIAEVDESYGAFTRLTPYALGLLNVEADHLDHYGTLENLEDAFADVVERTAGPVVAFSDDPGVERVLARVGRDVVRVGTRQDAHWRVDDVVANRHGARARLRGDVELELELAVTGRHNVANAAVAAVLALSLGVEPDAVRRGLASFAGAPRRFERVAWREGLDVIDDYAHLPGEIAATVAAARGAGYRHVVAVFQPHRITRTLAVGDGFAPAFDDVDVVLVTDIYAAGEANPEGVTGQVVAMSIARRGRTPVHYGATLSEVAGLLEREMVRADAVLLLGAGDVTRVLDYLTHFRGTRVSSAEGHFLGDDPRVHYGAPLGSHTTYRVGGSVSALVTLASLADLDFFSDRLTASTRPLWVVGNGSNLLVADGEHDVVAIHLDGAFVDLEVEPLAGDDVVVRAGSALDLPVAARRLAGEGIVGFEWAVGVPGTFGGAVAMNAGGHGSDMSAHVSRVEVWRAGRRAWRDAAEMEFAYRHSALAPGDIVTRVELRLRRGDTQSARERIAEIVRWRREHQPGGANAGSVFRNPEGDSAGRLIEAAGLKGVRRGSAVVSPKHANFIISDAGGTASDVFELVRLMRERVGHVTGVWLETEHRLLGFGETW